MKTQEKNRKLVMLMVTENCNLDCAYCYERNKTKKTMNIEVAKAAVEYEFLNSDGFDEIEFDLFGGEPTLRKRFVKELVGWTRAQDFPKPFVFFLQTNGTLVHGDFQDWLLANRRYIQVGFSLDGTPETHNKNRSNSYSNIDIEFFANNYAEQGVRMTINGATVGNLAADVIHLHGLGFSRIDSYFAYGIDWDVPHIGSTLSAELEKLCAYYLDHPSINECSIFDMNLLRLLDREADLEKWCGTGTSIVTIGVDGRKYPCQTFQPNTAPKPLELHQIEFGKLRNFKDPECLDCFLAPACPNCYGMNYVMNGDILKRDKQFCRVMRIRALAISYLRGRQIERGLTKMSPAEIYQTIEAIELVQGALSGLS